MHDADIQCNSFAHRSVGESPAAMGFRFVFLCCVLSCGNILEVAIPTLQDGSKTC